MRKSCHSPLSLPGRGGDKVGSLGEFGLIERVREAFDSADEDLIRGIGDDAAVIRGPAGRLMLLTTDTLIEDVHFSLSYSSPGDLGMKSVAVNISDIAAMGGIPRWFLLSLGLPGSTGLEFVDGFYAGAADTAGRFGLKLIGGDTVSSPDRVVISVVVAGEVPEEEVLYRNGAGAGDLIFVTGTIGDSAAGLELLKRGVALDTCRAGERSVLERHLRPLPRALEAGKIAVSGIASSMIDVSDGLIQDLGHICSESGVKGVIEIDRIPLSESCRNLAGRLGLDFGRLLSGGEDYELLFTVPAENACGIDRLRDGLGIALTHIGGICRGEGVEVLDSKGSPVRIERHGYEHFKNVDL